MKLKAILAAALLALGVTAAVAVAKPPPEKGGPAAAAAKLEAKRAAKAAKLAAKGLRCRGGHMNLAGEVAAVDTTASTLSLAVQKGNKKGRSYVGKQATVVVGDKTKLRRHGKATLADLVVGDRALVLVRVCRDAEGDASLLAKLVVAKAKKGAGDEEEAAGSTSTSTSTSTETETSTVPSETTTGSD